MSFLALTLALEGVDPDLAEAACFAAGAISVTLTDAVDDAILEPAPGELRLWPHTVLKALFTEEQATAETPIRIALTLGVPLSALQIEKVSNRVWEREWLKDFHAMSFGRRLWIVPHHEAPPADPAAIIVRLDPGLAFGTGTHPTTALCLTWLDAHLEPQTRVIDYGCGSGVLAIAAAQLGAARADCFDIDPQALLATRDNAAANHVHERVIILSRAADLPAKADVVIANILAGTLAELAPALCARLNIGGHLLLSGILRQQVPEVLQAYAAHITLKVVGERDGWSALAGQVA